LAPNGNTNLGVKDVINALEFIKKVAPSFGGSSSKVTIAGQSSGATMIRALLAAPSASSLFRSSILQSDPINYGHLRPATNTLLLNKFKEKVGCSSAACQAGLALGDILSAQNYVFNNAALGDNFAPAAGSAQPIRPVIDGSFITTPLDTTASFPSTSKPILVTTVQHEAASMIYGSFPALPEEAFAPICAMTFGDARTETVVGSPYYQPSPSSVVNGQIDARAQLQVVGTDYLWKCSGWTFSRAWVQAGGNAFVGQYVVGASYPGHDRVSICTQPNVICHQDDIQIVVRTVSLFSNISCSLTNFVFPFFSLALLRTLVLPSQLSFPKCNSDTRPSLLTETPMLVDLPPGPQQRPPMCTPSGSVALVKCRLVLVTLVSGDLASSTTTNSTIRHSFCRLQTRGFLTHLSLYPLPRLIRLASGVNHCSHSLCFRLIY
jgi:hypothetical protein